MAAADAADTILHYLGTQIAQEAGGPVGAEAVQEIVQANPVLLILDGLDEVSEKALRRRLLENVTVFVNQVRNVLHGDLRVVATTRPYGYSEDFDPNHYLHLTIERLSPEKVMLYAKRWTEEREPNTADIARILRTLEMCLEDRVVVALTQTPLQVTILLVIIRARGTPPKQKEELFDQYMDTIYEREQKNRPELLRTEQGMIYGLHKYLAYMLHSRAEADSTAALMDVSEFRDEVGNYLADAKPLLDADELQDKVDQIITEASQRLVLIESPQEGKMGFGLPTTREFFAAAHLADTARDSQETDARFKAIARSPHWRNVALFFAGRIARKRPGEAPSVIDVCRKIDTEDADVFLRRGAELVRAALDDRAFREDHHEIGAIQFVLTLLDTGFITDAERLSTSLRELSPKYRDKVVRPWLKERLQSVVPERLDIYAEIYRGVFGFDEALREAVRRAADAGPEEARLWALTFAIVNEVAEQWVVDLIDSITMGSLALLTPAGGVDPLFLLTGYLSLDLSPKTRATLAAGFLEGFYELAWRDGLPSSQREALSRVEWPHDPSENRLYAWAISRLALMVNLALVARRHARQTSVTIGLLLPGIAVPSVQAMVSTSAAGWSEFCEVFGGDDEPGTRSAVALFQFLLAPHDPERFEALAAWADEPVPGRPDVRRQLLFILGDIPPSGTPARARYHADLQAMCQRYRSDDEFVRDAGELNSILAREVPGTQWHPYGVHFWLRSGCNEAVEEHLDADVIAGLQGWLADRGVSEDLLSGCPSFRSILRQPELFIWILELASELVAGGASLAGRSLSVLLFLPWDRLGEPERVQVRDRVHAIWHHVLTDQPSLVGGQVGNLGYLYVTALSAGVVDEADMARLCEIAESPPGFLAQDEWYFEVAASAQSFLTDMLNSQNPDVVKTSGATLCALLRASRRGHLAAGWHGLSLPCDEVVAQRLWELACGESGSWQGRYIEGMGDCYLPWARHSEEWLQAMRKPRSKEAVDAWATVIRRGSYRDEEHRDGLHNLLVGILGSGEPFAKRLRAAACDRLAEVIPEIEPVGFDEAAVNLPLPRRPFELPA